MLTKRLSDSWLTLGPPEALDAVLAARFERAQVRREEDAVTWLVQRGSWGRLDAYACHTSLVLFLLGGLVGARLGFKGFVEIREGAVVDAAELRAGKTFELPFNMPSRAFRSRVRGVPPRSAGRRSLGRDRLVGRYVREKRR
ncbi:MAG: cytochrome c biogenesis protein ResB [Deltaproteobacteria bacterium]|nr:cytochrome c biogenesis protein ResB [Deltaproteobacteria bacterium]